MRLKLKSFDDISYTRLGGRIVLDFTPETKIPTVTFVGGKIMVWAVLHYIVSYKIFWFYNWIKDQ